MQEFASRDAQALQGAVKVVLPVGITEYTLVFEYADLPCTVLAQNTFDDISKRGTRWIAQEESVSVPTDPALGIGRAEVADAQGYSGLKLEVDVAKLAVRLPKQVQCLENNETGNDRVSSCDRWNNVAGHFCDIAKALSETDKYQEQVTNL